MGHVVITVPEDIYKEYKVASIIEIEMILQELERTIARQKVDFQKQWRQSLLNFSAWTDEEVTAIEEAREYIDQWHPPQLF